MAVGLQSTFEFLRYAESTLGGIFTTEALLETEIPIWGRLPGEETGIGALQLAAKGPQPWWCEEEGQSWHLDSSVTADNLII